MMTHFLKQLTEDTITSKRLLIPAEFVKKCGRENLTNPVVVEPTVGDPRKLELYEDGGGFWLRNGWQEFVDHYRLGRGCYLVFEYKSYSRFKLVMLDGNGLGLELPASSSLDVGSNGEEEEEDSVNAHSVEILGSSVVKEMNSNNGRQTTAENAKQKGVMSAVSEGREVNQEARSEANGSSFRSSDDEAENYDDEPAFPWRSSSSKRGRPITGADDVDEDFENFIGLSLMKNNKNNNHGNGGGRQQAPENAKHHKDSLRTPARKRRRRTVGGQTMKVNKETPRTNRVDGCSTPFMAEHKGPCSSRQGRPTTETAAEFPSQPDFLLVVVSENALAKKGLRMPGGFVQRHITNWKGKMVELQVEQETWPVMIVSDNSVPTLSKGWWAFARRNSLKVGDTLILVPAASEDVLTVHIIRCS